MTPKQHALTQGQRRALGNLIAGRNPHEGAVVVGRVHNTRLILASLVVRCLIDATTHKPTPAGIKAMEKYPK